MTQNCIFVPICSWTASASRMAVHALQIVLGLVEMYGRVDSGQALIKARPMGFRPYTPTG